MPKILIADDEWVTRVEIEEMLTDLGYDVVGQAETGAEAIEMVRDLEPDLVIMDVIMPGKMNGIDAAKVIKAEWKTPIVFVTGYGEPEYIEAVKKIAPFGYIMKPFDEKEIHASVEIALYKRELELKLEKAHEELERRVKSRTAELEKANKQLQRENEARKRIEEALRESEEHFRSFMESAKGFIVYRLEVDPKNYFSGHLIFVSPSIEDEIGVSPEANFGEWFNSVHPEDLPGLIEAQAKSVQNGDMFDGEFRWKNQTGEWGWCHAISNPVFDSEGKPKYYNGMVINITSQKHAERALRESEEKYKKLFDTSPEAIALVDEEGRFLTANHSMKKRFEQEIDGKTWHELMPKDLADSRLKHARQAIKKNETVFFEDFRAGRYMENYYVPLPTSGEKGTLQIIVRDITERKKAEEELSKREELHKEAQRVAHIGHWELRPEVGTPVWSDEIFRIFGLKPQEKEPSFTELENHLHPDDWPLLNEAVTLASTVGIPFDISFRVVRPNDEIQWMHAIGTTIKDEKGKVTKLFGTAQDTTDRKVAEEALRSSEEKFSKAFNNAPLLMTISSIKDGRYLEVNEAFVKTTGYSREEALGKTSVEIGLVAAEDRDRVPKLLKLDEHIKELEVQLTHANGSKLICLISVELIEYEGKKRLLSIASDITERKEAEAERKQLHAQLLQAQKMESVGRLAGGVAHDFNNNLSVIQGYTQLILEDIDPEDALYGKLNAVLDAAKRSSALTRQLLAFARKQTISPKVLDLNDTVEGTLKFLRRLIGENLELSWRPGSNPWPIKMDPAQIDQILANLCVNARDAIDDVGKVTIATKNVSLDDVYCSKHTEIEPGEYTMLSVSDNGYGMDEAMLNQIFDPFFTTKGVGEGTGLGLATVYGIVKQNNGFINVYSEIGQGTSFKIYIPKHQDFKTQKDSVNFEETPQGHGETVLLVEDDASVLDLAKAMLQKLGYKVLTTKSPHEATEMAQEHPGQIHLIMTDVVMPEMSGNDLASHLTKIRPKSQTLFMSGYTADVIAHQGILDEGVNFIEKPFSMKDLGLKIREVLEKKES